MRSASSVVGLERCVEVGHGVSVVFDALQAGAVKLAWLLRARGEAVLRLIKVGEDRMAHEFRVEPQNLHAVRVKFRDDFGFGAE